MKDLKFKIWIEIQQSSRQQWTISFCVHDAYIYYEEFFIEGYPIDIRMEEGKEKKSQTFKFNRILLKKIGELLFPNTKGRYIPVKQDVAWDYYHYTFYEGFRFAVHPVSMSGKFLRQEFEGTQEEIYNKCLHLNRKWISKSKEFKNG